MNEKIKLLGIILIIAVIGVFTACGDDEPTPCHDNHAIDNTCGKPATNYGDINGISVYRVNAVSNGDAESARTRAFDAYGEEFDNKGNINTTKVSKIVIIDGATPTCVPDGVKFVISLPVSYTQTQMRSALNSFGGNYLQ